MKNDVTTPLPGAAANTAWKRPKRASLGEYWPLLSVYDLISAALNAAGGDEPHGFAEPKPVTFICRALAVASTAMLPVSKQPKFGEKPSGLGAIKSDAAKK